MVYLESFRLPQDDWTDCYFSRPSIVDVSDKVFFLMETLRKRFPSPDLDDLYAGIPQATNMTGFTSWYPWNIFYQRGIEDLDFESITIFYGGNGSGKTTLLNVIAQKLNLQRSTLYNRSVRSQLRNNQAEQSNGETAFNYFVNAIKDNTLILLDEPENSLSAQWQMGLALFLQGAIRSQFPINHSITFSFHIIYTGF